MQFPWPTLLVLVVNVAFEGFMAYCGLFRHEHKAMATMALLVGHSSASLDLWATGLAGVVVSGMAAIVAAAMGASPSSGAVALAGFIAYHGKLGLWSYTQRHSNWERFVGVHGVLGVLSLIGCLLAVSPKKKHAKRKGH
ncbi:Transmembrane protein 107 [Plasmodiophora brassicae]|uniref:Uncharacterized protein n=1 Tax=Plasmodiophora brassicae TaxID=37360 RepID=A0A0G4J2W9_PLABS|nr:hypothetical protein PBRA_008858 [Plasmodiophora brassicae]SPQ98690.1 unnamed protein product [Plasmodiophora brassicae]